MIFNLRIKLFLNICSIQLLSHKTQKTCINTGFSIKKEQVIETTIVRITCSVQIPGNFAPLVRQDKTHICLIAKILFVRICIVITERAAQCINPQKNKISKPTALREIPKRCFFVPFCHGIGIIYASKIRDFNLLNQAGNGNIFLSLKNGF